MRRGFGFSGFGFNAPSGLISGTAPPVVDNLATMLASLEAASKLVCAWFLPLATPAQYLTLNGANVEGWAAAYGTQKVNLAEIVTPPTWDATLYGGKGGAVFNGVTQSLTGTGNVTAWPANIDDAYLLVACRQDDPGASPRSCFDYGAGGTSNRRIGINGTNVVTGLVGVTQVVGTTAVTGSHTIGVFVDSGATSQAYYDGVADGAGTATAAGTLTRTRTRLGSSAAAAPSAFWSGAVSCAVILNATATLTDFTNLEALMRGRLS